MEKGSNIDLIFTPQVGLGKIMFSFDQVNIESILGTPEEKNAETFSENEYVLRLYYKKFRLAFSIYFENEKFDYLSIFTNDIILDGFCFSKHKMKKILSFIKQYHEKNGIFFLEKRIYDEDTEETYFIYDNIGLTIWFYKKEISDICVQKTLV